MAAIISQIAANKRARAKQAHLAVSSDKCVYHLPPFDPCFDPLVHNKFMRAMAMKKEYELDKYLAFHNLEPGLIQLEKPVIEQGRYVKGKDFARLHPPEDKTKELEVEVELRKGLVKDVIVGCTTVLLGIAALIFLAFYLYRLFWKRPW